MAYVSLDLCEQDEISEWIKNSQGQSLLRETPVRLDELASSDMLTQYWMAEGHPQHCLVNITEQDSVVVRDSMGEYDRHLIRTRPMEERCQHPCAVQAEARRCLNGSCYTY